MRGLVGEIEVDAEAVAGAIPAGGDAPGGRALQGARLGGLRHPGVVGFAARGDRGIGGVVGAVAEHGITVVAVLALPVALRGAVEADEAGGSASRRGANTLGERRAARCGVGAIA